MKRGRPFLPGQSGNPKGAAAHDQVKKKIKRLTSEELEKILNQILLADPKRLDEMTQENSSTLKTWIASICVTGIKKGDPSALLSLLDRMIGKVSDKLKVTSDSPSEASKVIVYLPSNGRENGN